MARNLHTEEKQTIMRPTSSWLDNQSVKNIHFISWPLVVQTSAHIISVDKLGAENFLEPRSDLFPVHPGAIESVQVFQGVTSLVENLEPVLGQCLGAVMLHIYELMLVLCELDIVQPVALGKEFAPVLQESTVWLLCLVQR